MNTDDGDDKLTRQLNLRTRKRVKRPPIITPASIEDIEDETSAFTISRGSAFSSRGSAPRIEEDEPEVPRFENF